MRGKTSVPLTGHPQQITLSGTIKLPVNNEDNFAILQRLPIGHSREE
jgi:hypothetical protein